MNQTCAIAMYDFYIATKAYLIEIKESLAFDKLLILLGNLTWKLDFLLPLEPIFMIVDTCLLNVVF